VNPRQGTPGVPIEELVTHVFRLADINQAMETNIAMEGIKLAVVPELPVL